MTDDRGDLYTAAPTQFTENRKGLDSMGVPAPEPVVLQPASSGSGGGADGAAHASGADVAPADYDG